MSKKTKPKTFTFSMLVESRNRSTFERVVGYQAESERIARMQAIIDTHLTTGCFVRLIEKVGK